MMPTPTQDDTLQAMSVTAATSDNNLNSRRNNSIRADEDSGKNEGDMDMDGNDADVMKFPILKKCGIDVNKMNLSKKKKDADHVKRLIGELITLQQAFSKHKDTVEFYRPQQNKLDTAVVIRSHKSDDAFERLHRKSPYLDEVIHCMDNNEEVAAKRLALYLAKKHESTFISAGKEAGLATGLGIMNEIDCGAIISEAGFLDG